MTVEANMLEHKQLKKIDGNVFYRFFIPKLCAFDKDGTFV